ncbi:MAG TPA: hypothetical protein VE843_00005, partial [Ktedonobacteraceae bacterium]|nr:hypothetical protein [Ktedonobacteraceae bacterium]
MSIYRWFSSIAFASRLHVFARKQWWEPGEGKRNPTLHFINRVSIDSLQKIQHVLVHLCWLFLLH